MLSVTDDVAVAETVLMACHDVLTSDILYEAGAKLVFSLFTARLVFGLNIFYSKIYINLD